jgi:hypothetical protein
MIIDSGPLNHTLQLWKPVWKRYVRPWLGRWSDFSLLVAVLLSVYAVVAAKSASSLVTHLPNPLQRMQSLSPPLGDQVGFDTPIARLTAAVLFGSSAADDVQTVV